MVDVDRTMADWTSSGAIALLMVGLITPLGCGEQPVSTTQAAAGPKLEIPESEFDFGTIWEGQSVEHGFVLRNVGKADLQIRRVRASCGCTVVKSYQKVVKPGGETKLAVRLNTARLRGKVRKFITVWTNEPDARPKRLTLAAEVRALIIAKPRGSIFLGRIRQNERVEKSVELTNNTEQPLEVGPVSLEGESFTAELETIDPGQRYRLKVATRPPLKVGLNRAKIVLKTNLPQMPLYRLSVSALATERVWVLPGQVLVTRARPRPTRRFVYVRNEGDKPVHVTNVSVSDERIELHLEPRREGKWYRVQVVLPADYVPPEGGDRITIRTDDEEFAQLTVPIVSRRQVGARVGTTQPGRAATRPVRRDKTRR